MITSFKFQWMGEKLKSQQFVKICDLDESPVPVAKVARSAADGYILALSKSRFVTNRVSLESGTIQDLGVDLDSIQFTDGMSETQTRAMLANMIGTDSVIFIKRFTLNNNHYYTEHINANWYPGGNICVLNLRTGAVRNVLREANLQME